MYEEDEFETESLIAWKTALQKLLKGELTLGPCGLCYFLQEQYRPVFTLDSYSFVSNYVFYKTNQQYVLQNQGEMTQERIKLAEDLIVYIDSILGQRNVDRNESQVY